MGSCPFEVAGSDLVVAGFYYVFGCMLGWSFAIVAWIGHDLVFNMVWVL